MAISDIANTATTGTRPAGNCKVCLALADLPPDQAQALRALLANPRVRYTELSTALATDVDYPLDLHGDLLGKHARGVCAAREKLR